MNSSSARNLAAGPKPRTLVLAGALVLPAAVLLHELGHYVTAEALGFAPNALHFNSASVGAPPPDASAWVLAAPYGAGQLVSLLLSVLTAGAAWAHGLRGAATLAALALAVTFAEATRALFMLIAHMVLSLLRWDSLWIGFDELSYFARAAGGTPPAAFVLCLLGVLIAVAACISVLRAWPAGGARRHALRWIAVGTLIGYVWYFGGGSLLSA
ncbi:MAG: hypothetical protein AAGI71_17415 [Bacteroidota bacterium]